MDTECSRFEEKAEDQLVVVESVIDSEVVMLRLDPLGANTMVVDLWEADQWEGHLRVKSQWVEGQLNASMVANFHLKKAGGG